MKDCNINYHLVWQHSKDVTKTDRVLWLAVIAQAKADCSAPGSWNNWFIMNTSYYVYPNIRWLCNIIIWLKTEDFLTVCELAELEAGQTAKVFRNTIDETISRMPTWIKNQVRTKQECLPKEAADYIIERIR